MCAKDFYIIFLFRINLEWSLHKHSKIKCDAGLYTCAYERMVIHDLQRGHTVWWLAVMVCVRCCSTVCVHLCPWLLENACTIHMNKGFRWESGEFILHSVAPITQPPVQLSSRVLSPWGQTEGTEAWVGWRDATMEHTPKMCIEWKQKGGKDP